MSVEACRIATKQRAERDPFLGTPDGTPVLDGFFSDLDTAFSTLKMENLKRLTSLMESLHQSQAHAVEDMGKSRDKLAACFDPLGQNWPPEEKALKRLIAEIDAQLLWLYQKVRFQLDQSLKPFSPKKRPVGQTLDQIADGYAALIKKLPEEITLIRTRRKPAESLNGRSIFAANEEECLDRICASTWGLINRIRYHVLRRRLKRRYRAIKLPVRELARQSLPDRARQKDHPLIKAYEKAYTEAMDHLEDIWRNMRFNLITGLEELNELQAQLQVSPDELPPSDKLQERLTDARSLVMDILSHTAEKLAAIESPLAAFFEEIPVELELAHQRRTSSLKEDLLEARLLRARLRWALYRRLQHGRNLLTALRNRLFPPERIEGKTLLRTLMGRYTQRLGNLLGRARPQQESLLRLADLPSSVELARKAKDLPPVYRRMFNIGPLKSREFMVGREEEMETLEDILSRWQRGRACSVAVTGPEGSGKTSLLNCLVSEFGARHRIRRLEIGQRLRSEQDVLNLFRQWFEGAPAFDNPAEVVAFLHSELPSILAVEGGHNLLLRTIGGRDAAEAFLYILMATRKHCLWIMTFRKYPWIRLDYQLQISRYFTHQITTLFHSDSELREVLLLRQHTSGYPIRFSPPEQSGESDEETTDEARQTEQKELQDRFFRQLFESSSGNIRAALYYWQISIRFDPEEKGIRVAPLRKLDYRFLRDLDRSYLLTLAEILSHGGLSTDEHGDIFRLPALKSRLILDYLTQINLLETEGSDPDGQPLRYTTNPTFFGPISETLESLNILY